MTASDHKFPPGFHPFWFWNGPLDAERIEAQVRALAAAGCRGVFIHPRQGMGVPYLSAEFFSLVGSAVESCRRHGMVAHIYDEFPYPSGMAGGQVCMGHPEHLAVALQHHAREFPGGALCWDLPAGELLSCMAVPVRDETPSWEEALDLRGWAGIVYSRETWFRGGLSAYTNQRYFAHDPGWRVVGELGFGRWLLVACLQERVRGFKYWGDYVDVCDRAAMERFIKLTHEAYARNLGQEGMRHLGCCFVDEVAPGWSRHFLKDYETRHGEDLRPLLPALAHPGHPRHAEVVRRLDDLRYESFVEAFERPLASWCRDEGLLYVAEKPLLRLEQMQFVDIPGCDAGHRRCGVQDDLLESPLRHNARATASAAQIYGKAGACCEAFHSLGWSATLEDARYIVDLLLLHGIDRVVTHGVFSSCHGLRKHDAPPSWFLERPDWPLFPLLSRRIERIRAHLGELRHDADTLVIDPRLPRQGPEAEAYVDLLHRLTASGREFLIVDRVWLTGQPPSAGVVPWGRRRISTVIAPRAKADPDLDRWLEEFGRAGGEVLRGAIPEGGRSEGLPVLAGRPEDLRQARFQHSAGVSFLALNRGADPLVLQLPPGQAVQDVGDAIATHADGRLELPPYATVVIAPGRADNPVPSLRPEWPQQWRVERERANLLRLADWDLTVFQSGEERGRCRAGPRPAGDQLWEGALAVVWRRRPRFGQRAELDFPLLDLRLETEVETRASSLDLCLVVEQDALRARQWKIQIGGRSFGPESLRPVPHHLPESLGVELGPVPQGRHRILLEMTVDRDEDGMLAPLYLAGDFAVDPSEGALTGPMPCAPWGDLDAAGLAYYAGSLIWESSLRLCPPAGPLFDLELPWLGVDAYEVSLNRGPWRPLAWSPRRLRLRREEVREGENHLRVRQFTTLGRCLDGERWNPQDHRLEAVPARHEG